jgi:hypothetical protein
MFRPLGIFLLALLLSLQTHAQTDVLEGARQALSAGNKERAGQIYDSLYKAMPQEGSIYEAYFRFSIEHKDFKTAGKLAEEQMRREPQSPFGRINRGEVWAKEGKEKKAEELWNPVLETVTGDEFITPNIATAFIAAGRSDWAIKVYERAKEVTRNPMAFSSALARLYNQTGNTEAAISTVLESAPYQLNAAETAKATLLEFTGEDAGKTRAATKAVLKKVQEQPENSLYADLLLWLYTRRDDWEGALIQVQALDDRNREGGRRLLDFAQAAAAEKQWDIAGEALGIAATNGNETLKPYAAAEQLRIGFLKLQAQPVPDKTLADTLSKRFDRYATEWAGSPYRQPAVLRQQAQLEARYRNNTDKAIAILETGLTAGGLPREEAGRARLDLGDYQLLQGKIWDATLTYGQVDKAFREDFLGEEARFRAAKLAYYRGDFPWAQAQLSVLKASTSELIANDALELSVLITENIPPDSNLVPLETFAKAELLQFQNQDGKADALLDSVAKAFAEHPLQDDILLRRSQIAVKQQRYTDALSLLEIIATKYGKDVLADDALYQQGMIYEKYLAQPAKAKEAFERLLTGYPGSTLAAEVRRRMNAL